MTRTTVQAGFDTWADSTHPSTPHGDDKVLHTASGGNADAYIHTAIPATPGSTVVSAILTVYVKDGYSGTSSAVTVRRVLGTPKPWKARTLNWNNRPDVTNTDAVTLMTGTTLADKAALTFDVTALVQPMVSGAAKNYGFQLTGPNLKFYSAQAGVKNPTLTVEYVEGPAQPSKLRPGGGLVGVAQPTLQWDYIGADDLASYRVQTDPAANGTTPDYDSGVQTAVAGPTHALAGTTFADLNTDGASTYWRVQVTDTAGQTSDWSDWAQMTRDNKGALTLNNPDVSPNNYVSEPTPPILFTLTGETLTAFEVLITDAADRNDVILDSGKLAGSVGAYTLPVRPKSKKPYIVSGGSYSVCVRAYDTKQRQGSLADGDEPYVELWRDFTMADDAGIEVPVITSVAQFGVTPAATVTFTRGTAADSYVVLRDDEEIAVGLLPEDVVVSGTTYAWQDWSAHPGTAHAYAVKAVENGVQSEPSDDVALPDGTTIEGLWVIDPDTGRYFVVGGTGVSDWKQTEVGSTYWPLGARTAFRITQALGGLSGTFVGFMRERTFRSVPDMETDLWAMKEEAPHRGDFRLVADTMNIPVQVTDLACAVSEESIDGYRRRQVNFGFWQTGEFEFDGRV